MQLKTFGKTVFALTVLFIAEWYSHYRNSLNKRFKRKNALYNYYIIRIYIVLSRASIPFKRVTLKEFKVCRIGEIPVLQTFFNA